MNYVHKLWQKKMQNVLFLALGDGHPILRSILGSFITHATPHIQAQSSAASDED